MNWKALYLIASFGLVVSLAACSGSPENNSQAAPSTATSGDAMSGDHMSPGGAMSGDHMSPSPDAMGKDKSNQPGNAMSGNHMSSSPDAMSKDKSGAMQQSPGSAKP